MKMRWFVGLLMGLSFHSGLFTAAETYDETSVYVKKSPPLLMFSTPVPIQVGEKTVKVGGVAGLDTAKPVQVIENPKDSTQLVIKATYGQLSLYSYCGGRKQTGHNFDCVVQIKHVNYEANFHEKNGKYKVVGKRGRITNKSFMPTAATVTTTPTADLVTAFTKELMPQADPPSELVKTLETLLGYSFDVIF